MKNNFLALVFFASLFFTGCKDDDLPPTPIVLDAYVERFVQEANRFNVTIDTIELARYDFTLDDTMSDDGGHCYGDQYIVVIDYNFYQQYEANEWMMTLVVFHQLGHCLLGRDHQDREFISGYPVSIMHSKWPELLESQQDREYDLFRELFTQETKY